MRRIEANIVARLQSSKHSCPGAVQSSETATIRLGRQAGLSLLEIIVAMALLSIVMTLSVQSGAEMLERWQYRTMVKDVRNRIAGLPLKAALERKPVQLANVPARDIGLPDGWAIEQQVPLIFSRSGLCSDAEFSLVDPAGRRHTFVVTPPECLPVPPS